MSIAILNQVYDETRRLAIGGSVVAPGDFRLKKLIPQLEQLGAKAPVFAKVGEAAKAVVEGTDQTSAPALLDLATLVSAILYTQGETGAPGALEPIETASGELSGLPVTQTSARVIKPLLEALTTTGSGRLEIIRDAHERGAFRDLRLIRPALAALDDGYADIADFIAERVLPLYGKAILPELHATFDLKGRGGHPRRLRLMHSLDPEGTRDLVKQALDSGSKELRVAAIECLGDNPEDLSYLVEHASAKALDVRQAAYRALGRIDNEVAVAVLHKALAGKDLSLAVDSLQKSRSGELLAHLLAASRAELATLRKLKEKKEISPAVTRLVLLLNCLSGRDDSASESFLLEVFAQRADLAKLKGEFSSGPDLVSAVARILEQGTNATRRALAEAHASLPADDLHVCFQAALGALAPDEVYAAFSPYMTAKADEKKGRRDSATAKREAILAGLREHRRQRAAQAAGANPLDPRWIDLAVRIKDLNLLRQVLHPGHAVAEAFLSQALSLKKAKQPGDCYAVLDCMIHGGHPESADAYLAVLEKFGKKCDHFSYVLGYLIVDLPKSALPRLEALLPSLDEKVADSLLVHMQQLREKP